MKTASDPRHRQRIKIVQSLFSSSFQKRPSSIALPVWDHLTAIDPQISACAPEWPLEKLNPLDLAILRLAVYELTIDKKTPYKVIIDEAVEIAKEYGSDNSPGFINGVLGKIVTNQNLSE